MGAAERTPAVAAGDVLDVLLPLLVKQVAVLLEVAQNVRVSFFSEALERLLFQEFAERALLQLLFPRRRNGCQRWRQARTQRVCACAGTCACRSVQNPARARPPQLWPPAHAHTFIGIDTHNGVPTESC